MSENSKKILVVDDDEVTTDLAKTILVKNNFEVITASNGEDAIAITRKECPDLILLDIMLPTIDGFEVCKKLKSQDKFRKTPILILTAKGFNSDVERGKAAGADEYLLKPFSAKALVAKIRIHLGITNA